MFFHLTTLTIRLLTHDIQFGKLIIKGLVTDPLKTTLLGLPQGAFQIFFVLSGGYVASRYKNARCYTMALYLCPTIIGSCLLWKLPRSNTIGLLFGYYIVSQNCQLQDFNKFLNENRSALMLHPSSFRSKCQSLTSVVTPSESLVQHSSFSVTVWETS